MSEESLETKIGPSGYPGEYNYCISLPDGNVLSLLSGMHTCDTESIDWTKIPKIYQLIAIEQGHKTWIPRIVNEPELGIVFVDIDENDEWYWVAMKAKQAEDGTWGTDNATAKAFQRIEYLDALDYIGMMPNE